VCTLEKKYVYQSSPYRYIQNTPKTRGFLRRKKSRVQTQLAPIIIDKHELHSAWPVYCQHETRKHTQEGLTLIADREHTCYGPGDLITVTATLKSERLSTIVCRGFELNLIETTIFRGLLTGKKSAAPVVRTIKVCEYKHVVNANLHGGTQQRAELVCQLSPEHTTTTLNAARHIDITYVLTVKAIITPGDPVSIDLPVIVTNWQRSVDHLGIDIGRN
jgi:Arrestin (or S-antigen), C-terminal domain